MPSIYDSYPHYPYHGPNGPIGGAPVPPVSPLTGYPLVKVPSLVNWFLPLIQTAQLAAANAAATTALHQLQQQTAEITRMTKSTEKTTQQSLPQAMKSVLKQLKQLLKQCSTTGSNDSSDTNASEDTDNGNDTCKTKMTSAPGKDASSEFLKKEGFNDNEAAVLQKAHVTEAQVKELKDPKIGFTNAHIVEAAQAVIATNEGRKKRGIESEVHLDVVACAAAKKQAEDEYAMGECSHTGLDGSNPFARICKFIQKLKGKNVGWDAVQENAAMGQRSAKEAVLDWFASAGHAKNMKGDRLGVGYYKKGLAHDMTFVNDRVV